jgi:YegS/Rv2252/BmrU family lipid kinase
MLAREALHDGYEMIVAVGGDGTVNEVVNGFFEAGSPVNPDAVFGVVPVGTGCDFIKTMGIPKESATLSQRLCGKAARTCDVGHFTCADDKGGNIERYFINIADFGVGGEAVERVNKTTKAFGGFASFLYGAVSTLLTYKSKKVKIQVDESYSDEILINNVVIANGQYFGGGMWVAPNAVIDDGLFDVLIFKHMGRLESLSNIPKIYKGTHIHHPNVKYMRGKTVTADSSEVVLLDVEGEQIGRLPARFDIIPLAVKVKVGG